MGVNESDDSSVSDSTDSFNITVKFPFFFLQHLYLLLTSSFCPIDKITMALSSRPTLASSLIDVFSFVLRCFQSFELVHGVFRGPRS